MAGAARISDKHVCPKTGHSINTIVDGEDTVLINGLPAATVGSTTACGATIITGSSTVTINGKPAAVIGSATSHGGVILSSSGDVFFGDMVPQNITSVVEKEVVFYSKSRCVDNYTGKPISNRSYILTKSNGEKATGKTDFDGYTELFENKQDGSFSIHFLFESPKKEIGISEL